MGQILHYDPTQVKVRVPVRGSSTHVAEWEINEIYQGSWNIGALRVVDLTGSDSDKVLSQSNSVWEGVHQLFHQDDTFDASVDNFVGFLHNPSSIRQKSKLVVSDGDVVKPEVSSQFENFTRCFLQQNAQLFTPEHAVYSYGGQNAGSLGVYHVFETDMLRLQSIWHKNQGIMTRTSYAAMCPVTTQTPGGLNIVTIDGKPPHTAVHDNAYHYATDNHTPEKVTFSSNDHPFKLVMRLGYGAAGRDAGVDGAGNWLYCNQERFFFQDTAIIPNSPNGVLKAYGCFQSGVQPQVSKSSVHAVDYWVEV